MYVSNIIQINKKCISTTHIFFCGDINYIKYIGIAITNILIFKNKYVFHIFLDDISQNDLEKLRKTAIYYNVNINIYFINDDAIDKIECAINENSRFPASASFRIIAPKILKGFCDKVLYLDADILIKNDLSAFYKINMNDSIVAAVKDVSSDDLSEECNVEAYFNSGVILIDVNKWNEANITECCIQLLSEKRWKYLDQDILNIVLNKKVILLEERYNFQYSLSRILNRGFFAYHNFKPIIIHFIGSEKPWNSWLQYIKEVKEWQEIKEKSFWADIENIKISNLTLKKQYMYMHAITRKNYRDKEFFEFFYNYLKYIFLKIKFVFKEQISEPNHADKNN